MQVIARVHSSLALRHKVLVTLRVTPASLPAAWQCAGCAYQRHLAERDAYYGGGIVAERGTLDKEGNGRSLPAVLATPFYSSRRRSTTLVVWLCTYHFRQASTSYWKLTPWWSVLRALRTLEFLSCC